MFSHPKILFLVSLLFVALLNPKLNPYLLFKFLIFYHSYIYTSIRNIRYKGQTAIKIFINLLVLNLLFKQSYIVFTLIIMTEPAKTGLICTSNFMTYNSLCG